MPITDTATCLRGETLFVAPTGPDAPGRISVWSDDSGQLVGLITPGSGMLMAESLELVTSAPDVEISCRHAAGSIDGTVLGLATVLAAAMFTVGRLTVRR